MAERFDVIVIGGGMVGGTLGCALGLAGFRVAVVDARPAPPFAPEQPFDLRVSAVSRASQHVFEALGAWSGMAAMRACPFRRMRVWDQQGAGETLFDSSAAGEPMLGHIVENRVIQLALTARMQELEPVSHFCPVEIAALRMDVEDVGVTLADGRELRGALLVGADGANSMVRQHGGIDFDGWAYDQHALVASVATRLPQQDITWQRFTPDGPQAFLPLPGPHASLVWYQAPDEIQRLKGLADQDFQAALEAAFPGELGGIREVLARASFPLRRMHAEAYVQPRLALVGDAAHTIHPLAGQGVNLGIMDAAVLAEELACARQEGDDPGSIRWLRRYERRRRPDNLAMMTVMDGFHFGFTPKAPPLRWMRNAGMTLAGRITPVNRLLMRYAMGLAGDVPALARGEVPVQEPG